MKTSFDAHPVRFELCQIPQNKNKCFKMKISNWYYALHELHLFQGCNSVLAKTLNEQK